MVVVRTPRRRRWLWTGVLGGAAVLGAVGPIADAPPLMVVRWMAMVAATIGLAVAEGDPGAQGGLMCELRVDDHHVLLSGPGITEMWPRDQVVDGYVVPSPSGEALVLCAATGREITIADPSRPAGEMLAELGLDRRSARMSLVADPRAARGCVGLTVAPVAAGIGMAFAIGLGSMIASIALGPHMALLGAIIWVGALMFSPLVGAWPTSSCPIA